MKRKIPQILDGELMETKTRSKPEDFKNLKTLGAKSPRKVAIGQVLCDLFVPLPLVLLVSEYVVLEGFVSTPIPSHEAQDGPKDGPVETAVFGNIWGLATDSKDNLYLSDPDNGRIRKVTPAGIVSTYNKTLDYPCELTFDPAGNLFVVDYEEVKIKKITPSGVVTTFAGDGTSGIVNGPGATASFNDPRGLGTDAEGNLYVADCNNHCIRKITPDGIVSTFAGSTKQGLVDGKGTSAQFHFPSDLALDKKGNVYIADRGNMRVRKITPDGVVSTFDTEFPCPRGVTVDSEGYVYVGDTKAHCIREIAPSGEVALVAGGGKEDELDGEGATAFFKDPYALCTGDGCLYVLALVANCVRKIV